MFSILVLVPVVPCNTSQPLIIGGLTSSSSATFIMTENELDFIVSTLGDVPMTISSAMNSIKVDTANLSRFNTVLRSDEMIQFAGDSVFGDLEVHGSSSDSQVCQKFCSSCWLLI